MSKDRPAQKRRLLHPWTGMTLPGLAQGSATLRPEAPALVEPDNTEVLAGRKSRLLSCKALVSESDLLAHKLRALGVKAGDVVLTYLPNTSEAVLTLLAVQKVGGIPAPVPVFEPTEFLARAAALSGAVAIVTMDRFAGLNLAAIARDAAVAALDVRIVAAFGDAIPEGVARLDAWDSVEFLTTATFPRCDGPDVAVITFDEGPDGLRALARSHEQLVAEATGAASLGRIATGTRLLATLPPASAAGIIYGVALPLLTGAWVEMNPLFDSAGFAMQLGSGDKTSVILPGVAETSYRAFRGTRAVKAENIILVHRLEGGLPPPDLAIEKDNPRIVDVLAFGEAACVARPRAGQSAGIRLPVAVAFPVTGVLANNAPSYALSRTDDGCLAFAGTLAPTVRHAKATTVASTIPVQPDGMDGFMLTSAAIEAVSAA